ncbi:Elongation of very long chain fatty acids protein AAEL008004 [Camponotus floridanus]|uniref:Elongation of very long chain fatty acids protein AAEL008004 n=1 Tax=Camponotus floridanus TaxID=104421 RepID=E2AWI5_CAMFO|nr:Elongation of very long chain fatty acids protein AAEL008004 [Camponotus floridanus]
MTYLLVVLYWGPRFMKNKQPYSLKTLIKIYNFCQIIANAWLVREHLAAGWMKDIPLTCMPVILMNHVIIRYANFLLTRIYNNMLLKNIYHAIRCIDI